MECDQICSSLFSKKQQQQQQEVIPVVDDDLEARMITASEVTPTASNSNSKERKRKKAGDEDEEGDKRKPKKKLARKEEEEEGGGEEKEAGSKSRTQVVRPPEPPEISEADKKRDTIRSQIGGNMKNLMVILSDDRAPTSIFEIPMKCVSDLQLSMFIACNGRELNGMEPAKSDGNMRALITMLNAPEGWGFYNKGSIPRPTYDETWWIFSLSVKQDAGEDIDDDE